MQKQTLGDRQTKIEADKEKHQKKSIKVNVKVFQLKSRQQRQEKREKLGRERVPHNAIWGPIWDACRAHIIFHKMFMDMLVKVNEMRSVFVTEKCEGEKY